MLFVLQEKNQFEQFNIFRNVAVVIGSLVTGKVYQKLNQHLLFSAALLLMATCVFVAPSCGSFWSFLVTMTLQGFFASFIVVGEEDWTQNWDAIVCLLPNSQLFLPHDSVHVSGSIVFLMDLWGNKSDPFVQARTLFLFVGNMLCVQVAKQFLADRTSVRTNVTTDVAGFANTTDTSPTQADRFESDIKNAYFFTGALCIVGMVTQILSWIHSGHKLNYLLQDTEEETSSLSQQNPEFSAQNTCCLSCLSSFALSHSLDLCMMKYFELLEYLSL